MGFLEFLKSLPAIIGALIELKKMWDECIQTNERREKIKELSEGLREAREKKDTSRVENLLRNITTGAK